MCFVLAHPHIVLNKRISGSRGGRGQDLDARRKSCGYPELKRHDCKTLFADRWNNIAICGIQKQRAMPLFQRDLLRSPHLGITLDGSDSMLRLS